MEIIYNDYVFAFTFKLEEDIQFNAQLNEIIIGIVGMIEIEKYKVKIKGQI